MCFLNIFEVWGDLNVGGDGSTEYIYHPIGKEVLYS